jgi:hypothetical protein
MNQLEIIHKSNNTKQVVSNSEEIGESMRERKGAALVLTRNVFYLENSKHVYYVQSERSNNIYYFVKYNPDVFEYCSCLDNSIRGIKCKHIWSIEKSICRNTLKQIEHLPENAIRYPQKITAKSYRDDDYEF